MKRNALISPITYWGGKKNMTRHILPIIPQHEIYVEPFFGGGAVFFEKERSKVEIINDINRFVINFYQQTKRNFPALKEKIDATAHSRALYSDALVIYQHQHLFTDLDKAWAFWTLCNEGYAGKIGTWGYGTIDNKREYAIARKRDNFVDDFQKRLDVTQIECDDALKIIELRDRPQTFFYVDPPYIESAQGHYAGYTKQDFINLLDLLSRIEGKFVLSSYPSNILNEYIEKNGWHSKEYKQPTMSSPTRKPKIEVLTANFGF